MNKTEADRASPVTTRISARSASVPLAGSRGVLRRANSSAAGMFLLPNIVMIAVFTLLPLIFAFVISFQNLDSLGGWSWVGFGNYVKLVTDPVFWQSMTNTGIFTLRPGS